MPLRDTVRPDRTALRASGLSISVLSHDSLTATGRPDRGELRDTASRRRMAPHTEPIDVDYEKPMLLNCCMRAPKEAASAFSQVVHIKRGIDVTRSFALHFGPRQLLMVVLVSITGRHG